VTALNFVIQEDQICFAMDTLSLEADDRQPLAFITKFVVLPHLQTVVTGTGHAVFVAEWMAQSRGNVIATDVDHLNKYTPDILKVIASGHKELNTVTATIYHFGYSESRERFVGYVYRSTSNWKSEEILEGTRIKPVVEYDFGEQFQLPSSFIELMKFQREQDLQFPIEERVGIGGHIHFVVMNRDSIHISIVHRFSSYEVDYQTMCRKAGLS